MVAEGFLFWAPFEGIGMAQWVIWLLLAGAMVILEMFTGTFYLLMLGIGLAAGGLAALAGAAFPWQFMAAAVVGALAILALHHSRLGRTHIDTARDPNVNLDIGQTIEVDHWHTIDGGISTARVMHRGAQWDVQLAPGGIAQPGLFIIREVRGSRFIVVNRHPH
jgi:membrane protein implicated in regulation of membrane protease activity